MAERYAVTRLWIKHKGTIYRAGDLLPEDFTHHDRFRNLYPSRIGVVDIPETPADTTPITPPTGEQIQLSIPGIKPQEEPPLTPPQESEPPEPRTQVEGQLTLNLDDMSEPEDEGEEDEGGDEEAPEDKEEIVQTPAEPPKPPITNKPLGTSSSSGALSKATKPAGVKPLSAKPATGAPTGGAKKPK
jgi:hypothetical protein